MMRAEQSSNLSLIPDRARLFYSLLQKAQRGCRAVATSYSMNTDVQFLEVKRSERET